MRRGLLAALLLAAVACTSTGAQDPGDVALENVTVQKIPTKLRIDDVRITVAVKTRADDGTIVGRAGYAVTLDPTAVYRGGVPTEADLGLFRRAGKRILQLGKVIPTPPDPNSP